jgi:L-asparaginase II
MLSKCERGVADLECGTHMPFDSSSARALVHADLAPTAIHNNCSGKHAGFICLACHLGVDPKGYVEPGHVVQREVTEALAATTDTSLGADNRAVDGCSIPTYAIPLDRLALAFARVVSGEGLSPQRAAAARRLAEACMAEPWFVAGTGRFCTDVMAAFPGRLLLKTGAEGVYCAGIPELGFGIALKCEDGTTRAAEVMMAATIEALLPATASEPRFAGRLTPAVDTRKGIKVGEVRPVEGLVETIRDGRSLS